MNTATMSDEAKQAMALTHKISESVREVTGMPSEVFLATVRGNMEQTYREHLFEAIAKHGWDPANLEWSFFEAYDEGLRWLLWHHEAKALRDTLNEGY